MKGCLALRKCLRGGVAGVVLSCLAAPAAIATPITYVFSGPATGTLNGTPFTDTNVTVTATADTANIVLADPGIPCVPATSVVVNITGVGAVTATAANVVFDNQSTSVWGTTNGTCAAAAGDWIDQDNALAATYALATSLGPTTGTTFGGGNAVVPTTGGPLQFSADPLTFQATLGAKAAVTPIPALGPLELLLLGLMLTVSAVFLLRQPTPPKR
jgi:hypothetical protein